MSRTDATSTTRQTPVSLDGGTSTWVLTAWVGLVVATPCHLAWQALASAVRQLLAWRGRPASA